MKAGGLFFVSFVLVTLFIGFLSIMSVVSAAVYINEIELNPVVETEEYVELFNDGISSVNISGWVIIDSGGNADSIPNGTEISAKGFFVFEENISALSLNNNDSLNLTNDIGTLIDNTPFLEDDDNDGKTWQRVPNGVGSFVLKDPTKGANNVITEIQNKSSSPLCVVSGNNVTFSVQVNGECINEVKFLVDINGSVNELIGVNTISNNYITSLNTSTFLPSQNITWTVQATNCYNETTQNGNESFYVNNKTSLTHLPSSPDGIGIWYINNLTFNLTNNDATNIWYKWDSGSILNYLGIFGLEDVPNGPETGGLLELNYWSNVCNNESVQSESFNVDLANPIIKNLFPVNASTLTLNNTPLIFAYIDDPYGGNSGINLSSVWMKFNDVLVIPDINGTIFPDTIVSYQTSNLSNGIYNVTVNASDNAGRNSELTWFFTVNKTGVDDSNFSVIVNSPENKTYDKKQVNFSITVDKKVSLLEYRDENDNSPRWRTLCRNCDSYGYDKTKTKSFSEGKHNVTFRATDIFGNSIEENVEFFIDSKAPKIIYTLPKAKRFTNGQNFSIKYTEDNLQGVFVSWNPSVELLNCTSGKNQVCSTDLNLSAFDGQEITYYFNVSDGIRNITSKSVTVNVDTTTPAMTVILPINDTTYGRRVPFEISVSEEVLLQYFDLSDPRPRWKTLCSNCGDYGITRAKSVSFKSGNHEILIMAMDKAGNAVVEEINFQVN